MHCRDPRASIIELHARRMAGFRANRCRRTTQLAVQPHSEVAADIADHPQKLDRAQSCVCTSASSLGCRKKGCTYKAAQTLRSSLARGQRLHFLALFSDCSSVCGDRNFLTPHQGNATFKGPFIGGCKRACDSWVGFSSHRSSSHGFQELQNGIPTSALIQNSSLFNIHAL